MTYSNKLKHPKWQKKRLEILQRDQYTCQLCNDTETTLHVHHKSYSYGKEPWDYDNENLITYCELCHGLVERYKMYEFTAVRRVEIEGYFELYATTTTDDLLIVRYYPSDKIYETVVDTSPQIVECLVFMYLKFKKENSYEFQLIDVAFKNKKD